MKCSPLQDDLGRSRRVGISGFTQTSCFTPPCRCIGSIQYLKSKFGKGYLLEIKVKDPESTDLLHTEVLRIFPSAARQER